MCFMNAKVRKNMSQTKNLIACYFIPSQLYMKKKVVVFFFFSL